jgi:hypothetical protein
MRHKWQYNPFSTHHGWELPEYKCELCGKIIKSDILPEDGCQPLPWISFTVPEVQYLVSMIVDIGEAWYQAGILQGDKKEEEFASKLTDDLIAHIKFKRKIKLKEDEEYNIELEKAGGTAKNE